MSLLKFFKRTQKEPEPEPEPEKRDVGKVISTVYLADTTRFTVEHKGYWIGDEYDDFECITTAREVLNGWLTDQYQRGFLSDQCGTLYPIATVVRIETKDYPYFCTAVESDF